MSMRANLLFMAILEGTNDVFTPAQPIHIQDTIEDTQPEVTTNNGATGSTSTSQQGSAPRSFAAVVSTSEDCL